MSAQCAICLLPIERGGKFVLAGTEVFHDLCAAQKGTHTSVGNQRRQRLSYLEAAYAEHRRNLEEQQTTLRVLKDKVNEEMEHQVAATRDMEASANSWRRRYENARLDVDRLTVERDRAMRELAVARQAGVTTTPESKPTDTRDATEIRFSLLEIDSD